MKIDKIKISGYKNLDGVEFELKNFNVLIGSNNSGKSNFLEIFSFLKKVIYGSDKEKLSIFNGVSDRGRIITNCKNVKKNETSISIEYSDLVEEEEYKYVYELVINYSDVFSVDELQEFDYIKKERFQYKKMNNTGPLRELFVRNNKDIDFKWKSMNKLKKIDAKECVISILNKLLDFKQGLDKEVIQGINDIELICDTQVLYSNSEEIRNSMNIGLAKSDKNSIIRNGRIIALNVMEYIDKILKSDMKDMYKDILLDTLEITNIEPMRFTIAKEQEGAILLVLVKLANGQTMDLTQMSDGTLMVLNIITYLISNEYPILAIEELENSIHPKLLKKMVELIKNTFSDKQIIITTHSPVLLNMVEIKDVSIIHKNEKGISTIDSVTKDKKLLQQITGPFSDPSDIFYIDNYEK